MFKGEMIRSIITPREVDGNRRMNKLERQHQRDPSSQYNEVYTYKDSAR